LLLAYGSFRTVPVSNNSPILAVAILLATLAGSQAWGAADASSDSSEKLQEVTVAAQRAQLADRLAAFVSKISGPVFDGGLPLWGQPVCPLASGLAQEDGEFVVGRIADVARAGRVPLAGGKCHPNLYILVTSQPQKLLKTMTTEQNFQFTFGISTEPMDGTPIVASHIVIDDFISKPGPVRVLYRDAPIVPSGVHPFVHAAKVGPVDASQLKGVTLGQLADYAALVGLTEIKPADSLADAPTILQLFNGTPQAAPTGMTDWDRAFLKSLYTTRQHMPAQQRWHVVQTTVSEVAH